MAQEQTDVDMVLQREVWLEGVGKEKIFFYPLIFCDWGMLIKLTKRWINRRKGNQILFDVTILMFMCMETLEDKK